jgi:hypothetical protein
VRKSNSAIEKKQEPPSLPEPPAISRSVKLMPLQRFGMPLILALPLIAAFGVFQSTTAIKHAEASGLSLYVDHPAILRFRPAKPLEITLVNQTGGDIPAAKVKLNREYIEDYGGLEFDPSPDEIDAKDVTFNLSDIKAGDARRIVIEFEAISPGSKKGHVIAEAQSGDSASVAFTTFVLP